MARTRKRKRAYPKPTFVDALRGPEKAGAETLLEGVLDLYPKADGKRLEAWLSDVDGDSGIERDAVLFFALVCGTRYRVYLPVVNKVLSRLWQWLTWSPRHMDRDLAALLVDALAPALDREFKAREGRRVGPGLASEKLSGRPPTSRGACVTALAIDGHLRRAGVPAADATERSLELAAILTGRELVAPEELRRTQALFGGPGRGRLADALSAHFEWYVDHDGLSSGSPKRSVRRDRWRRDHTSLSNVLKRIGSQTLAEQVVARIPPTLWTLTTKA
jgi:hypothetical protein